MYMKTLYESILDDEDEVMNKMGDDIRENQIREFIGKNYSKLKVYKIKGNKVSTKGFVFLNDDAQIESLTEGLFEWEIQGCMYCNNNPYIKSLKGAPKKMVGTFACSNCANLESLEGAPKQLGTNFICDDCPKLKSLKGGPIYVKGGYSCQYNNLESLEGAAEEVGVEFSCSNNPKLKSLKGLPKKMRTLSIDKCPNLQDISDMKNSTIMNSIRLDSRLKDEPEVKYHDDKKVSIFVTR